jgi:hypothetical protein
MKVYAFDVDETLDISGCPIPLSRVAELRDAGHIVGICGNFAVVTLQVPTWSSLFSFIGPMAITKADFLRQISTYVPADSYVMVGNDPLVFGASDDANAAREAGWEFVREADF